LTAVIPSPPYLQIIYRNIVAGLDNVPRDTIEAGRGMGMTPSQLLWRVELPLALPEIVAGLRIATVSTVAIATLAVFAGGGGLGDPIYASIDFKTNVIIAGGICVLMAVIFDVLLVVAGRLASPWRRCANASVAPPRALLGLTGAIDFILNQRRPIAKNGRGRGRSSSARPHRGHRSRSPVARPRCRSGSRPPGKGRARRRSATPAAPSPSSR
jgi:hypothetical protein